MKGTKRNLIGAIFIFGLMLFLAGCNNKLPGGETTDRQPEFDLANMLTRVEIEKALSEKGFHLANTIEDDGTYKRNDITPEIYYFDDTEAIILYDFISIAERVQNAPVHYLGDTLAYDYALADNYVHWNFPFRNFLLVYRLDTEAMPDSTFENKLNDLKIIKQVALDLNEGEEVLIYGKSENWEAHAFIQYYQNWYKDKDGLIRVDQISEQNVKVRYCGPENEKPQSIQYEYKYPSGSGKGTSPIISADTEGWVKLSNSSGFIPNSQTVCTLNLIWGNNNETINMTPK